MTQNYLILYDSVKNQQGCVISARAIIVRRIMEDTGCTKIEAQDRLSRLINERVRQEAKLS